MEAILSRDPSLSKEERDIVIELLDRECANLPVEIHHTRTGKFREYLRHRQEIVERILMRLKSPEGQQDQFTTAV